MRQRGLTLLEMLIATTISTLVVGSAIWLATEGLGTSRRTGERVEASEEYLLLAKRLRAELSCTYYSPLFADSFQGSEEELSFCYPTGKGLRYVRWVSNAEGIWQQVREPGARQWRPPVKLSSNWQGKFFYLDQDGGWQNTWHSGEEESLPPMVRLELTGPGTRELTVALAAARAIPY